MNISSILRLANQVEIEYLAFLKELKKLEVLEYPTTACNELISKLEDQALENKKVVGQIRNALISSSPPADLKLCKDKIVIKRLRLVEQLTYFLDRINGAQTQKVPWSFIPSVERIANQVIPDYCPVLFCNDQFYHKILWEPKISKSLDKYSFISLPRLHKNNILMHTLIGHELFHPCCKEFIHTHENSVAENITRNIAREVDSAFPILGETNAEAMFLWRRAIIELMCDMFCAIIFGPAALLAMRYSASFSDWKTKPKEANFYPPFQYRFEIVWQNAIEKNILSKLLEEKSEKIQLFKSEIKEFGKTLEADEGFKFVCADSLDKIAYAEVNNLIPKALDYVKSKLPESVTKWTDEKVLVQVPKLVDRLTKGIPPNEIPEISFNPRATKHKWNFQTEPAELPAILIAGWVYQIYRENNMKKKKILPYDTLSRLLLKACEDSEILISL